MGKIKESVLVSVQRKLLKHIRENWADRVVDFQVRARGHFVYVDVEFAEAGSRVVDPLEPDEHCDDVDEDDEDDDDEESLPPLMRLRSLGRVTDWQMARYDWSQGRPHYEPCLLTNGQLFGTPEECFDAAAFPWR